MAIERILTKTNKVKHMGNILNNISEIRRPGRPAALFMALSISCLPACSDRIGPSEAPDQDVMRITLVPSGVEESASSDIAMEGEDAINDVKLFRFDGGVLQEIISPSSSGISGEYTFKVTENSGELQIMANSSAAGLGTLVPGTTTSDDFLGAEATPEQMSSDGLLMSGVSVLTGSFPVNLRADLVRSLARLDVRTMLAGVEVMEVQVSGFAEKGRIHSPVPAAGAEGVLMKDYSAAPLSVTRERIMYLAAQTGSRIVVRIKARYGGGLHQMETVLPDEIRRNSVYTVNVHGNGAGISASVSEGDWESVQEAVSVPVAGGLVDVGNSVLPDGVRVSSGRDSVFVTYLQSDFILAISAEPGARVEAMGKVTGVDVSFGQTGRSAMENVAEVRVRTKHRVPGSVTERIYLTVGDTGTEIGRIVIIFEANPVVVNGKLQFDLEGVCDFGTYADGELARMTLPAGRRLWTATEADEAPWLISEETETDSGGDGAGKTYRIIGGWKPNDPLADGRVQAGSIFISDEDGRNVEEYTVRRRNWGLPVVKMGENWWCLYNLRGNVKSFEDQITCGEAPAAHDELMSYLSSVPEDELLELMGDQYQGGNTQGLPLRHDGTAFYHEGMKPNAQNFGTADPSTMAPDGYLIPDYDDYLFFSANNNFNLGGIGERPFNNKTGQRLKIRIAEREVSFLGEPYGNVSFYEFEYDGNHWILYGLGHQWNTTAGNIAKKNLLMATYGNSSNTWVMEGYAADEKPGENWIKFVANNSTKTRMIRCIKAPVEYIYD